MSRYFSWEQLDRRRKAQALALLRRRAMAKTRYDGTLLPYAWAERVAPLLRYTLTTTGAIWDASVTHADRRRGYHLFTLPPLDIEAVEAQEVLA